jgi:hypothetical protein
VSQQRAVAIETEAGLKTPRFAIVALVTAALSIVCPPLGIVAVLMGLVARLRCRSSLRGEPLATSAIALGAMTSVAAACFAIVLLGRSETVRAVSISTTEPVHLPRRPVLAESSPYFSIDKSPEPAPIRESRVGKLLVIDIGSSVRSLSETLEEQLAEADVAHEKPLLWTVVPDCAPCARVATALQEPRLQDALVGVRLLRVNAADFAVELSHLNVPIDAFPGFSILGRDGNATDYVHGGEWDDDVADNIAPVLESFVRGTYLDRRDPWRGGPRDDETSI